MQIMSSPSKNRKTITIVSPTFNEEEGLVNFLNRLILIKKKITAYKVDIIIIDNASTDNTQNILRKYAQKYKFIKVIFNVRNFGHVRSPYWGIIQSTSDITIYLASDLEDPPDLIFDFIRAWENGYLVVYGVRRSSDEKNLFIKSFRAIFYKLMSKISEIEMTPNATGFGLYDKEIIKNIIKINDPYPYLRGLVAEIGYPIKTIPFDQKKRVVGKSKNNLFSLISFAILGLISHSLIPLRICTFFGFFTSFLSFLVGIFYLFYKLIYWESFEIGLAPLIVSIFLFFGLLFFFIGIIGEYIGLMLTYQKRRPVVIERERINF